MVEYYDTHAHLDAEQLREQVAEVIHRANVAGVTRMLAVGTNAKSSEECVQIAKTYAGIGAAVGVQPNYCHEVIPGDWEKICDLAKEPEVLAIGETGLDLYWKECPWDLQQDFFRRQIELAQREGLPFIVHMRECEREIVQFMQAYAGGEKLRGVMHSFTGNPETTAACLELGLHVSFAGMLTYKKGADIREVAKLVPDDRLLIETDSPYLSPEPKRSQRPNEPALVVHTARCLAEVRNQTLAEIAALTTRNALALFQRK